MKLTKALLFSAVIFSLSCEAKKARHEVLHRKLSSEVAPAKDPKLLTVFSWNILNFGDKKQKKLESLNSKINAEKKKDIWDTLGAQLKNADLIAFQEVSTKDFKPALNYLRKSLQKYEKGEVLCMGFSDVSKENLPERERFAFVWRDSRIQYVTTAGKTLSCAGNPEQEIVLPLVTTVGDKMGRMPAYAKFKFKPGGETVEEKAVNYEFYYVNLHLRPDKTGEKNPRLEIPPLAQAFAPMSAEEKAANDPDNLAFLKSAKAPVIISGDFNMSNSKSYLEEKTDQEKPAKVKSKRLFVFQPLMDVGFNFALDNEPTSLKQLPDDTADENLATLGLNKPYDNFWYRSGTEKVALKAQWAGVHNLYEIFKGVLKPTEVYKNISDHSPVEAQFEFIPNSN